MKLRISPWLITALIFLAFPLFVMWPDRRQGGTELRLALFLLRYQIPAAIICCAGALATLLFNPSTRTRRGIGATAAVLLVAGLTQFNVFEFLFHPAGSPAFESIAETKLDPNEKLIAVNLKQAARAYPVHSVAYHHVVNDVLAGVPIAVTY